MAFAGQGSFRECFMNSTSVSSSSPSRRSSGLQVGALALATILLLGQIGSATPTAAQHRSAGSAGTHSNDRVSAPREVTSGLTENIYEYASAKHDDTHDWLQISAGKANVKSTGTRCPMALSLTVRLTLPATSSAAVTSQSPWPTYPGERPAAWRQLM